MYNNNNYDERFNNPNNFTISSSDGFSGANVNYQTNTSYNNSEPQYINNTFFNNTSNNEFDDDEIEMLWDDDEVVNNDLNSNDLENTQIIETTDVVADNNSNNVAVDNYQYDNAININNTSVDQYIANKKANRLCILSIVSALIYLVPIIGLDIFKATPGFFQNFFLVFSSFANIFPVISICLIVYTRTKYPFNKFVNILVYIYIAIFVVFVIIYLIFIFSCLGDIPVCFNM